MELQINVKILVLVYVDSRLSHLSWYYPPSSLYAFICHIIPAINHNYIMLIELGLDWLSHLLKLRQWDSSSSIIRPMRKVFRHLLTIRVLVLKFHLTNGYHARWPITIVYIWIYLHGIKSVIYVISLVLIWNLGSLKRTFVELALCDHQRICGLNVKLFDGSI